MPVMPVITADPDITVQILQTCLFYIFSYAEVKRVFWVVPVNDKERNKIALKAGFRLHQSNHGVTIDGGQAATIYQCSSLEFF
jgi:hypothetical protein